MVKAVDTHRSNVVKRIYGRFMVEIDQNGSNDGQTPTLSYTEHGPNRSNNHGSTDQVKHGSAGAAQNVWSNRVVKHRPKLVKHSQTIQIQVDIILVKRRSNGGLIYRPNTGKTR